VGEPVRPAPSPGPGPATAQRLSIELVGIPGAGKSRLARTLSAGLIDRGIAVSEPRAPFAAKVPTPLRLRRKAVATGAAALTSPVQATRLVRGLLRSRQPGAADVAGRFVQLLLAQDTAARAIQQGGVSIVSEGIVQALWSIGIRGDVRPVLEALDGARRRPSADLLVVLEVAPELALARLTARTSQHSRTQLLDHEARLPELERGTTLLRQLVDWWSSPPWGRGEVYVVRGAEEDGDDRARLLDHICARLASTVS
jgi:hypothetical protein